MALRSGIEWIDNSTPVVTGCRNKGAGCKNCYAPRLAWRLAHSPHPALAARYAGTAEKRPDGALVWTGRVNVNLDQLDAIQAARRPQTWFLSHVGDVFHDDVPTAAIDAILTVAALKPEQRLVLLTKRPHRAAELLTAGPKPLANVWLGASIANDSDAAEAVVPLSQLAATGWQTVASYEPAVGPVNWERHGLTFLRGIISGGESGAQARPTQPNWHRATRDFCLQYGIAFFFKQWGEWCPMGAASDSMRARGFKESDDGLFRVGKKAAGRLLDGRTWDDLPWRVAA